MPNATARKIDYNGTSNQWVATADVLESDGTVATYAGFVDNDDAFKALTGPQKKAAFVAAIREARNRQVGEVVTKPAWTGVITL